MSNIKKLFGELVEYIVVFLIILECSTVYSKATDFDLHIPEIIGFASLILVLLELLTNKVNLLLFKRYINIFITYYFLIVTYMIVSVKPDVMIGYIARFIVFLPLFSLFLIIKMQKGEFYTFAFKFSNIMVILASISIFFWLIGSRFHLIMPNGYIRAYWGVDYAFPSYYGLYVERQVVQFLSFFGYRNQGIFCEAPMYSVCLVLATAIKLFFPAQNRKKRKANVLIGKTKLSIHYETNILHIIIMVVAILTTVTTTGYIMLVLMFAMRFVLTRPKTNFAQLLKIIVLPLMLIIGGTIIVWIFIMKSTSMSWLTRLDDYNAGFKAWLVSPIFGAGYSESNVIQYMSSFRSSNLGFSNSIFQVLSRGGLVLFSVYLIGLCGGLARAVKTQKYYFMAFCVVMIFEFICTIFGFNFLMLFMLSFEYAFIISERTKNKNNAIYRNSHSAMVNA